MVRRWHARAAWMLAASLLIGAAAPQPDAPGLPGATAASRTAARSLIIGNHMDAVIPSIMDAFRNNLVVQLTATTHKPRAEVAGIVDQVLLPAMKSHADELVAAMVEVYAADFSTDELRELSRFYATPVGQKMLQLQPLVARQMMAAGQVWAQRILPDAIRAHAQELRDRGLPL